MINEKKLDYSDILIIPQESSLSSRKLVNTEVSLKFPHYYGEWSGIPIVAANMDGVGTFSVAKKMSERKMITFLTKFNRDREFSLNFNSDMRDYVGVSSGINESDLLEAIDVFKKYKLKWFCIDIANGYSKNFLYAISYARRILGNDAIIVAGNVVTGEISKKIIESGADIVKVGIGPGSVCTTRIKTGVGFPQFSSVLECSEAVRSVGGLVMADGGCTCPGDVSKSFLAGASLSMIGGMLAGHTESEQTVIKKYKKTGFYTECEETGNLKEEIKEYRFVEFYGMSSKKAQENHGSSLKNYRASEGREVLIPFRGNIEDTLQDLLGGIRSTCTYVGAENILQIKRAKYNIVNSQYNKTFEK
jgi:GMP reductase